MKSASSDKGQYLIYSCETSCTRFSLGRSLQSTWYNLSYRSIQLCIAFLKNSLEWMALMWWILVMWKLFSGQTRLKYQLIPGWADAAVPFLLCQPTCVSRSLSLWWDKRVGCLCVRVRSACGIRVWLREFVFISTFWGKWKLDGLDYGKSLKCAYVQLVLGDCKIRDKPTFFFLSFLIFFWLVVLVSFYFGKNSKGIETLSGNRKHSQLLWICGQSALACSLISNILNGKKLLLFQVSVCVLFY